MIVVLLPWPAKALHPNYRSRVHWPKARATKKARADAGWATKEALAGRPFYIAAPEAIQIRLRTIFHPPGAYHYDADNLMASAKALFDGISDALGIDDNHFHHASPIIAEPVKGGKVIVEIS